MRLSERAQRLDSLANEHHPKRLATLETPLDHELIARLKDVQRDRRAGKQHSIQWKER
jgi:hypothetical protein